VFKLAITIIFTLLTCENAYACAARPEQLSLQQIKSRSAVIVEGVLTFRIARSGQMIGTIKKQRIFKGPMQSEFKIAHSDDFDPACQNYGWDARLAGKSSPVSGRFYLFKNDSGNFEIARFAKTGSQ
jgi:hypothetical protein